MRKEKIARGGGKGVKKFGIFKSISNFQFFNPNHLTKQKSILQVANFSFLLYVYSVLKAFGSFIFLAQKRAFAM